MSKVNEFSYRMSMNSYFEGQSIVITKVNEFSHFKCQWILISKVNEISFQKSMNSLISKVNEFSFQRSMNSHIKGQWNLISEVNEFPYFKGEWVGRGEDEDWRGSAWLPARLCGSEYEGEECRSMKVYEGVWFEVWRWGTQRRGNPTRWPDLWPDLTSPNQLKTT